MAVKLSEQFLVIKRNTYIASRILRIQEYRKNVHQEVSEIDNRRKGFNVFSGYIADRKNARIHCENVTQRRGSAMLVEFGLSCGLKGIRQHITVHVGAGIPYLTKALPRNWVVRELI